MENAGRGPPDGVGDGREPASPRPRPVLPAASRRSSSPVLAWRPDRPSGGPGADDAAAAAPGPAGRGAGGAARVGRAPGRGLGGGDVGGAARALHRGSAAGRHDRAMLRGVRRARAAGAGLRMQVLAVRRRGAVAATGWCCVVTDRLARRRRRRPTASGRALPRDRPSTRLVIVRAGSRGSGGWREVQASRGREHGVATSRSLEPVAGCLERGRLERSASRAAPAPSAPAPTLQHRSRRDAASAVRCTAPGQRVGELRVGRGLGAAEVERARWRCRARRGTRRAPTQSRSEMIGKYCRPSPSRAPRPSLEQQPQLLERRAAAVHHRRGAQHADPGARLDGRARPPSCQSRVTWVMKAVAAAVGLLGDDLVAVVAVAGDWRCRRGTPACRSVPAIASASTRVVVTRLSRSSRGPLLRVRVADGRVRRRG